MRRSRMTTRRWMIAVAVVGLLLGVVVGGQRLQQRRDCYLQQANNEARWENYFRSMASRVASRPPLQQPSIIFAGRTYSVAELAAEYAERKVTYLHAASRPWISVPPARRRPILIRDVLPQHPSSVSIENSRRNVPESGESPIP
jgi:hypothetical protein